MALSFSRVTQGGNAYTVHGHQKKTITDVTFDSSYPTGGEAFTASDLGLQDVHSADATVKTVAGTVNVTSFFVDLDNDKIVAYDESPAEVANAASLDTLVARVTAYGV